MAESNQSPEPLDMDSAINHVAGLLGELEPDLSDRPEDEEQSEEPEDQDQADESDAEDSDDGDQEDADDEEDEDEDDGESSDDDDQDPWKVARKVTVDGKQIEISPEEALAGYQRQSAFTRKTQEISELKKTLNESLAAAQTEQQRLVQTLQVLEQALTPAEPNWDELRKNPSEYERERVAYLERKEQFRQFQEARKQSEQKAQETAKQARDSRLDEQRELLMTAIPEWVDSDRASKESADMVKYAMKQYGYSAEDFSEIDDHRVYVILRKAMLYDGAKQKPGKAKAAPKSPSLKPGSKTPRGKGAKGANAQQKALSRLKKTGSMGDAIEAVIHMIDD